MQKIRGPKSGPLICSLRCSSIPLRQPQHPEAARTQQRLQLPAAAPEHPHTAWTQHPNVFALRLCKSATCRQHLSAENKGSKIWTPFFCSLHCSSISLNNLNIPKQHVDSNVRSSFSLPTSSPQHPHTAWALKCVCPSALQIIDLPAASKCRK